MKPGNRKIRKKGQRIWAFVLAFLLLATTVANDRISVTAADYVNGAEASGTENVPETKDDASGAEDASGTDASGTEDVSDTEGTSGADDVPDGSSQITGSQDLSGGEQTKDTLPGDGTGSDGQNQVPGEGDSQDESVPEDDIESQSEPETGNTAFTLTVKYQYALNAGSMAGRTAANTYYTDVREGDLYRVESPVIAGYTASLQVVEGTMPGENLTITVTYSPTTVQYQVIHRFQQLDGTYSEETETKEGLFGGETQAEARSRQGFEAGAVDNVVIGNDTRVVIDYTRIVYTLRFDSLGGSYVTAIEAPFETEVALGEDRIPTRNGYVFEGWVNAEGEKVTSVTLTDHITLTASWAPDEQAEAGYKIMYWIQKSTGDGYDFLYSHSKNGKVGAEVKSSDVPAIDESRLTDISLDPSGFSYSSMDTGKRIEVDGSTIVNVYYNRKMVTLTFQVYKSSGFFGGEWVTETTITDRYGAPIGNRWPSGSIWYTGSGQNKVYYANLQQMPVNDITFKKNSGGWYHYTIHYMVEPVTGTEYTEHHADSYSSNSSLFLSESDRYDIEGFTFNEGDRRNKPSQVGGALDGDKNYLYYTRNTYTVEFSANGGTGAPAGTGYKYQASMTAPAGTPEREGYRFLGWFYDPGAVNAVNWGKDTMPANNLTLYAGWEILTFPVTLDVNYEGGTSTTVNVPYQHTVAQPDIPERDGYAFLGWYTQAEGGEKYDFGTPVTQAATLYAHWSPKQYTSYTVRYLDKASGSALAEAVTRDHIKVGKTVTEWAVDIEGYVPDSAMKQLELAQSGNEIIFYYSRPVERSYTIVAREEGTEKELYRSDSKKTMSAAIWIKAPELAAQGYVLADGEDENRYVTLSVNANDNVFVFYYEKMNVAYQVVYYVDGVRQNGWTVNDTVKYGTVIRSVPDKCPKGYHEDHVSPQLPVTITPAEKLISVYYVENDAVTITYTAQPGGEVTSGSETLAPVTGTAAGSEAKAAAGYHFVKWTDELGTTVGTEAVFVPSKTDGVYVGASYYAVFAEDESVTIRYKATAGGEVSRKSETVKPVSEDAAGSTAKAAAGYHFVNWTDETGAQVGTSLTLVPARKNGLNVAAEYTANFEEDAAVRVDYVALTGGSVSRSYEMLAPATGIAEGSTAVPNPGYEFVRWLKADQTTTAGTNTTLIPEKVGGLNVTATYYALFREKENITVRYQADANGSVSVTEESLAPATGTAQGSVATADTGYRFVNWTNSKGTVVGNTASFVPQKKGGLNVPETYTAHFEKDETVTKDLSYTVEYWLEGESSARDTVTVTQTVWINDPDTLTVEDIEKKEYPGYTYKEVKHEKADQGILAALLSLIPSSDYPETVGNGDVLKVMYTENEVTIRYAADANGSVTASSETVKAVSQTATGSVAKAANGYHFVNWKNSAGEVVGTDAAFVPEKKNGLNVEDTYTAYFAENDKIVISYVANVGGSVTPGSEELAPATGIAAGSTAAAAAGYRFVNWTDEDGKEVSTDLHYVPAKVGGVNVAAVYYANFEEKEDITINYVARTGGSVSPESETLAPATGAAAGSTAAAAAGYRFVNWTDKDGKEVSTALHFEPAKVGGVNVAATYYANFAEKEDITINYVARTGGSVSPESETLAPATGTAAGSTAAAAAGYRFVNWTDEAGKEVSTALHFEPAKVGGVNVAATYYANFTEKEDITINYVARTGGSVSPESETLAPATGTAAGSTAAAAAGYRFVNWTDEDGKEVSTALHFEPAKVGGVNVAATYYANFTEKEDITIHYVARTGGSVSSESETLAPATGTAAGSTAAAAAGYRFVNWTDEAGKEVSTALHFEPAKVGGVNVAATYYANFAEKEDITINYVARTGGSVSPESETLAPATGTAAGSTAAAAAGYRFVNWTDEAGKEVSTALHFEPAKVGGVNVAATYYANFAEKEDITINYVARIGGSVSPESETLAPATGTAAGSTAAAAAGYRFVNWTDKDGKEVSTALHFEPAKVGGVNVAATYYANFAEKEDITILYQADENGSVSPAKETLAPATGTAQGSVAAADTGYRFVNWTNSKGEEVGTQFKFVPARKGGLNVPETYTAHFEKDETVTKDLSYTVEYWLEGESSARDTVTVTQTVWINDPDTLTVEDIEKKEYPGYTYKEVKHEKANQGILAALLSLIPSTDYPETVGNGDVLKVMYTENEVTIRYAADANGSVTKSSETVKAASQTATGSVAKAANGYHFVNWKNSAGEVVGTDAAFVPEKKNGLNVEDTYTAYFAENDKIVISYVANVGGSVTPGSEELAPATGIAAGSTAAAAAGYTFVNWTDKDGNEVSTDLHYVPAKVGGVNVAAVYYANFKEKADVTIHYVARTGGSVSVGEETLAPATGTAAGSTAAAAAGYRFVNWTDKDGKEVSTALHFEPAKVGGVNVAATYYANFAEKEDITINYVAGIGGRVSVDREILAPATGTAAGSTAAAAAGYTFVNWTDASGKEVSTDLHYVPAKVGGVNVAATYYANFEEKAAVTIRYVARTGGSVSVETEILPPATGVAAGSVAAAAPGYTFVNWTDEAGKELSKDLSFVPEKVGGVNVAATYYANFEEKAAVTIRYVARTGGSVSVETEILPPATGVAAGSAAEAAAGYTFVNWTDADDQIVGTEETFIPAKVGGVNVEAVYYANFREKEDITITYIADGNGKVDPEEETLAPVTGVALGSTAEPETGYKLENWTDSKGTVVSSELNFVPEKVGGLNVPETYTAHFVKDETVTRKISYRVEYWLEGKDAPTDDSYTVEEEVWINDPDTMKVGAIEKKEYPGYTYSRVEHVSAKQSVLRALLSLIPSEDLPETVENQDVLKVLYTENEITIHYAADANGSVNPDSETLHAVTGEAQGSTARAAGGYHFVNWTNEQGEIVSTNAVFVPEKVDGLNVEATYTAHFAANPVIPDNPEPEEPEAPAAETAVLGDAAAPEVGVLGESKGPGTADTAPVTVWLALAAGAAAVLAASGKKRRKAEK